MTGQRILLRLAFDGTRFWGSQRQPGRPTVDGQVLDTLEEAGLLAEDPDYRPQGRTDRGVSATDFPVAVTVTGELETIARTVAGRTQGIVPWGGAPVDHGFDPRRAATARTYAYHLPLAPDRIGGLDLDLLARAWGTFEGTHDFTHLSRTDRTKKRDPTRTILATSLDRPPQAGASLTFRVSGRSFVWNQVRRMVAASLEVARGGMTIEDLEACLAGSPLPRSPMVPAGGLVLEEVELPVPTDGLPGAAAVAAKRLVDQRQRVAQHQWVLNQLLEGPGSTHPRR